MQWIHKVEKGKWIVKRIVNTLRIIFIIKTILVKTKFLPHKLTDSHYQCSLAHCSCASF